MYYIYYIYYISIMLHSIHLLWQTQEAAEDDEEPSALQRQGNSEHFDFQEPRLELRRTALSYSSTRVQPILSGCPSIVSYPHFLHYSLRVHLAIHCPLY